jgi:hypothetical protein
MAKTSSEDSHAEIRDTLFGDMPFTSWPSDAASVESEPWKLFVDAREQIVSGDSEGAKQTLHQILSLAGLESRHYLQAWHFLRGLDEQPPAEEAKRVHGVIVEVGMEEGADIVAAYSDHCARYFNYSGAAIVWEKPNNSLDDEIDAVLEAGRVVVAAIGPWDGERPPEPTNGQVRINILVPGGLHFGEAPFAALANDPMGGPVITAAMQLMQELIAKTEGG